MIFSLIQFPIYLVPITFRCVRLLDSQHQCITYGVAGQIRAALVQVLQALGFYFRVLYILYVLSYCFLCCIFLSVTIYQIQSRIEFIKLSVSWMTTCFICSDLRVIIFYIYILGIINFSWGLKLGFYSFDLKTEHRHSRFSIPSIQHYQWIEL